VTDVTRQPRRARRVAAVGLAAAAVGVAALPGLSPASAAPVKAAVAAPEVYPVPPSGSFTLHGRGYGHGHGMSQWGAYGAAKVDKLSANQILHFYYPHTTLATRSTSKAIRVLITAAAAPSRGYLDVLPAPGLAVTQAAGKPSVLPSQTPGGLAITGWRLRAPSETAPQVLALREQVSGKWRAARSVGPAVTFTDPTAEITVDEPAGPVTYRGHLAGELQSGSLEAVNTVNLELYLRSVVPAEMSSTWTSAALQAQAVAARTYATRGSANPKASWFDVFGDTRDQAYGGVGYEATRSTKAINANAGEVIVDATGKAILAQYAAADGGWTVSGGVPYLPAKADPYDGLVPNPSHAWTTSLTAAAIESAYPALGTLRNLTITGRDGNGVWGGRVTSLDLVGSKSTVSLSGTDLRVEFGLRSEWFRPIPPPGPPTSLQVSAAPSKLTVRWKRPTPVAGASPVTAYVVRASPGSHVLTVAATARTATISGLGTGTYTVGVRAKSAVGTGLAATATGHVPVG
jgi:stage II sporulation protein D